MADTTLNAPITGTGIIAGLRSILAGLRQGNTAAAAAHYIHVKQAEQREDAVRTFYHMHFG